MDDSKHVQIIIAGMPGSGKTTVKEVVEKALRDAGLDVTSVVDDYSGGEQRHETWRYVEAMKTKKHTVGVQVRPILNPVEGK